MGFFSKFFSGAPANKKNVFSPGDIFYTQDDERYRIYKPLIADDKHYTWHVLAYEPVLKLPVKEILPELQVAIYHIPIATEGFASPHFLCKSSLTAADLTGYHEYLRQTESMEHYASIANDYYLSGLKLTDEKKHTEAIDAYSKAIDLVPTFFEAIDNRAFCKMDQGRWEDAINDFNHSLKINPGSLLAEFSIGECYFRLGMYLQAKARFEKAMAIDPIHEAPKAFLQKVNTALSQQEHE